MTFRNTKKPIYNTLHDHSTRFGQQKFRRLWNIDIQIWRTIPVY